MLITQSLGSIVLRASRVFLISGGRSTKAGSRDYNHLEPVNLVSQATTFVKTLPYKGCGLQD